MANETVSIPSALSSPEYQMQSTQLARQLADFKAQQQLESSQYKGEFNQNTRRLGYNGNKWDPTIPNGQFGMAAEANKNDFAGRGMTYSGAHIKNWNNINSDYNDRLVQLERQKADYEGTQAQQLQNMTSQQEAVRQQAQAAAVAAIAAKYGVNLDQVGIQNGTSVTREAL